MMISKIKAYLAIAYALLIIPLSIALMYCFPSSHRKIRQITARVFLNLFGIKARVIGEADEQAQLLICNHQSFMDVIYFEAVHNKNLCWVAKKELGDPFLYGHALKAPKMILIKREDKKELLHLLKEVSNRLEQGRMICIFPEGTRSEGKEELLPFKNGAKLLAEKFHLRVQPVVLCGTRKCFDMRDLLFDGSEFDVKYLPSFVPDSKDWYEQLRQQMQKEYDFLYQQREG